MDEQLSLFESEKFRSQSSITTSVIEQKKLPDVRHQSAKRQYIQRYLNRSKNEPIASVNSYLVRGRHEYFRLSYRVGSRVKHIHLAGGNTSSKLANYRANKLRAMINRGADLAELLAAIEDWQTVRQ